MQSNTDNQWQNNVLKDKGGVIHYTMRYVTLSEVKVIVKNVNINVFKYSRQ